MSVVRKAGGLADRVRFPAARQSRFQPQSVIVLERALSSVG